MKRILFAATLIVALASCKKEEAPDQVMINSINITDFPMTNDAGGSWDASDDADLYIAVAESNVIVWTAPSYFENATNTTEYLFTPSSAIPFLTLTNECQIDFYDWEDGTSDEWMGGVEFTFEDFKEEAKETLSLTSGTFTMTLNLEWGNQ